MNSIVDLDEVTIYDLFETDYLQKFQDLFSNALKVACITVDSDGNPVTNPSGFTDFCIKYTRGTDVGMARCIECDKKTGKQAALTGKPIIQKCHAGLVDFAAPILIGGKQIGSILGGQVLTDKNINEEDFLDLSRELGIKEDEYLTALRKVPYLDYSRVEAGANLLYIIAQNIAEVGYQSLTVKSISKEINLHVDGIFESSKLIEESSVITHDIQTDLRSEINKIENLATEVESLLSEIKRIATKTRLLSFNASIEAARAGDKGLGFAVVAKEMGILSDSTHKAVDKISAFTSNIKTTTSQTVNYGNKNLEMNKEQMLSAKNILAEIENTVDIVDTLVSIVGD